MMRNPKTSRQAIQAYNQHNVVVNEEISEDESRAAEENIQSITNDFIKKVDSMLADKEKELMEV